MTPIALALVEHADHLLIGRRAAGRALAGYWEFPGGKVEAGETPAQAAARECLEEAGLAVVVEAALPTIEHRYEHDAIVLHAFTCRPVDPSQPPRKPFRWVARNALAAYRFPPANDALLARLLSRR